MAHNRYQQAGGEDRVVEAEAAMLARGGHEVTWLTADNDRLQGGRSQVSAALSSVFSVPAYLRARRLLAETRPDVLHVHNFMPSLSPSLFFAAAAAGVPVVQTLHNYRLVCANAELFHGGDVCERCPKQGSFLPGVMRGCYRGSRAGSAVVGGSMALHGAMGTWETKVSRYIALTSFAARKLGGVRIPAKRIRVKPNFVPDPCQGEGGGGYALFAGRLSEEKGLGVLLAADAAGLLPLPVYLAGDGPEREAVARAAARPGSQLVPLGFQNRESLLALVRQAEVLLVPSLWFEGFPMVVAEAFGCGTPVIASALGSLEEIVEEGQNGFLHAAGSAESLVRVLQRFVELPRETVQRLRTGARHSFETRYNEAANLPVLLAVYAEAIAAGSQGRC